jgi:peptidoglycan/xylan/chitin deacetylase (PgdA/CDA1 family)
MVRLPLQLKHYNYLILATMVVGLVASAWSIVATLPKATGRGLYTGYPLKLRQDYALLQDNVQTFEDQEARADATVVSAQSLQNKLSGIQLTAARGEYVAAEKSVKQMLVDLTQWRRQLARESSHESATTTGALTFMPILIYHYTPPDLDQQLTYLEQHGYTVVGLDEVAAAFDGTGTLPDKPVAITFDDGFENQMQAFAILTAHHMKATFYIINGGAMSNWCIGAGRHYGDPSQPPGGCGDSYLNWDQVRLLDRSGLITIGGHTLDHPELTTLSIADQEHEIIDSKQQIEAELGHPIYDFAYPYGNYDDDTINIVRSAGYRTAVTTNPNDYQSAGSIYTLSRIRDTYQLP